MLKGLSPEVWGNGEQIRDFVYVKDVMVLLEHIMEDKNAPRVLNVGSGKSLSFNEIIHILNELLEKNIAPIYKHKPTGYLDTTLADISLAKNLYNFKPTTIESGIRQYIAYLDSV
jgi:UDP-glucose 4-epimerase